MYIIFYHNFNGNNIIEQNFRRINKNNINTNIINVYNSINQKESYGTYNNDEGKNQLDECMSIENKNIIFVTFLSSDQKIRYSIPCKKTDSFSKIEQKLYKKFPEYKDKNIYFLVNGEKIDVNKTLEENNIKDGDVIIFVI